MSQDKKFTENKNGGFVKSQNLKFQRNILCVIAPVIAI